MLSVKRITTLLQQLEQFDENTERVKEHFAIIGEERQAALVLLEEDVLDPAGLQALRLSNTKERRYIFKVQHALEECLGLTKDMLDWTSAQQADTSEDVIAQTRRIHLLIILYHDALTKQAERLAKEQQFLENPTVQEFLELQEKEEEDRQSTNRLLERSQNLDTEKQIVKALQKQHTIPNTLLSNLGGGTGTGLVLGGIGHAAFGAPVVGIIILCLMSILGFVCHLTEYDEVLWKRQDRQKLANTAREMRQKYLKHHPQLHKPPETNALPSST